MTSFRHWILLIVAFPLRLEHVSSQRPPEHSTSEVRLLYSKLGYAAAAPPPELLEILDVSEIRRENKVFFTGLEPNVWLLMGGWGLGLGHIFFFCEMAGMGMTHVNLEENKVKICKMSGRWKKRPPSGFVHFKEWLDSFFI